jgi:YD repeat-containing protein
LNNQDFIGGGVRIKQLINSDKTGVISTKNYTYVNDDNSTSGILMSPLKYIAGVVVLDVNGSIPRGPAWALYSSSYIPFSNSAKGNLVGYSRIVQQDIDNQGTGNGKTITEYNNKTARYFGNLPQVPNMLNGFVTGSKFYRNDVLIRELKYNYKNLYSKYYRFYKATPIKVYWGDHPVPTDHYYGDFYISYYPVLSEWNVLDSKAETDYYPQAVTATESYQYNLFNKQLLSATKDNSNNTSTLVSRLYPSDMISSGRDPNGIYQGMLDKHLFIPVIEEKETRGSQLASLKRVNYYQPYTGLFVPQTIDTRNVITGTDETRLRYQQYDNKGNIQSVSAENGPRTTYLWSYNGQYPVIEIKNADYATIVSILGSTTITNLNAASPNKSAVDAIVNTLKSNTQLKDAQISSYTYTPLVGMTSSTDAKGETTTYEYDSFLRLMNVKDKDGNIVRHMDYHYQVQ